MRSIQTLSTAALVSAGLVCSAGAQTKITYGSWAPENGPAAIAANAFFEKVTKETKGSLSFVTQYDGKLVNIRTTLPGVKDGLVDAAYVTGSIFPNEWRTDHMLNDDASVQGDVRALTAAFSETMLLNCPQCRQEVEKTGAVVLGYMSEAPFYLQCAKPFASLQDVKGKQVRSVGAFQIFAKAIDAVPVTTAPSETYEAMQRGAVTCFVGGGFWLKQYGLADVAKYVVDRPLGQYNNGSVLTINQGVWKDLSAEHKRAVLENMPFLLRRAAQANIEQDREAREASKAKGVAWALPSAEFNAVFAKFREGERPRVIKAATDKGIPNAEAIYKKFDENLAKWTRIVAETGDDWNRYEEALRREIYAKFQPAS
jgi:TRAP-type C4-dicarboxylate transport system substrate-binding protein